MPISKYFSLNLLAPLPTPIVDEGGGGFSSGREPYDALEKQTEAFGLRWGKYDDFRASLLAWELGHDEYKRGQEVKFSQFAYKVLGSSHDDIQPMQETMASIDEREEIRKREQIIRIAKYTALAGGVWYVAWRVGLL